MDRQEIVTAIAVVLDAFGADGASQERLDAGGAAALDVAAQVIVDLHRIADAQERIADAQERIADALEKIAPAPMQDRP